MPKWSPSAANLVLNGAAAATLLFPIAASLWLRSMAKWLKANRQPSKWVGYARWISALMIVAVPVWWSLTVVLRRSANAVGLSSVPLWFLLVIPLSTSMLIARLVVCKADAYVFAKKWAGSDVFRLAFWRTASSTIPLLILAAGIERIYDRQITGFAWMVCAAILTVLGKFELREAEGLKPRPVKSGELYKRSMVMSKKMGVRIRQVCVVPFGKGRLTNAYGGIRQIAVTDDYGHWLHGAQLDFVICHELAHVRQKDALRSLAIMGGLFLLVAIVLLVMPRPSMALKIFLNFAALLFPLMVFYALSRRKEYDADRLSVEATGEPAAALRALAGLYARADMPSQLNKFVELFSTHPGLTSRIGAIAKHGGISAEDALLAKLDEKDDGREIASQSTVL